MPEAGERAIYKVDAVSSPGDMETEMINNQIHIESQMDGGDYGKEGAMTAG